jgi:transcriptional regulator with XRE-family HTH domain
VRNAAIPRRFGQRLRALRKQRELSQEKLAELAGLHFTYVSSVERGKRNLSLINIVRLARALKVSPALLLQDSV